MEIKLIIPSLLVMLTAALQMPTEEHAGLAPSFALVNTQTESADVGEPTPQADLEPVTITVDERDVALLAKLVWGEARGVKCKSEQAAVIWCVLNRVEHDYWPDTISGVVKQRKQFTGYRRNNPVEPEFVSLAEDVLIRWELEKIGFADVGRVLPKEYTFFSSDGNGRNRFRSCYERSEAIYWDWTMLNPYE